MDVFFTHHAYLERKFHPSIQATRADAADTWSAGGEFAWRFTDRLGGEIEVSAAGLHPDYGEGSSGIGDVEIAPMVAHGGLKARGGTVLAGTVGFRYGFANGQQWGAGLQVPVSGRDAFDARLVVGGIIHID